MAVYFYKSQTLNTSLALAYTNKENPLITLLGNYIIVPVVHNYVIQLGLGLQVLINHYTQQATKGVKLLA